MLKTQMLRALATKELRESAGLVAVAGLGVTWMLAGLMGYRFLSTFTGYHTDTELNFFAFINDDFVTYATALVGGLAIALGLKQSAWEHGRETYFFMLHRPIPRRQVFAVKLVVGVALITVLLAFAIIWYGWRASIPGKKPVPFEWSMSVDAWKLTLVLPLVYLGAFLSGMRPGKWFGTRLAPLAAAILWAAFCSVIPLCWVAVPLLLAGYASAIVSIDNYTETRDY